MHPNVATWLTTAPILLDGAWGTEFQARGLPPGACPDALNLERPDWVAAVAGAYIAAGARAILTNTFGANRFMLARHDLTDRLAEINRRGAEISRAAAGPEALVFGSVGPTGQMLLMGDVTEAEIEAAFTEQIEALAAGGVDAIAFETMADLDEVKIALTVARRAGLPAMASLVYDSGPDHDRTMMGITPEQAAETLAEAGADIIGSNCGHGSEGFVPLAPRLKAASGLPLWLKPNAGLPEMQAGRAVYRQTPADFAQDALALVAAGADFIGGCCGTTPEFIRATAATLATAHK
ncbi:MAG: homocysteine S-methyltransferase family protein [Candidatus Marinimicrobia bacterium]|nr:homocysteine S-methyltransferase family protein [Candidatus Neomarinimicrobiota bacterium]